MRLPEKVFAVIVFAGLALAAFIPLYGLLADAQVTVNCYGEQGGDKHVAASGCEYEFQSGSTLDVQSGSTVNWATDLSIDGDTTITGTLNTADTDSVLTGAQTITPTYSYLQVSPPSVLTLTLATGSAEDGDRLDIHNLVATTTTIIDTGATAGGGNITLGQDDIAGFIFGDGVWIERYSPDNS